MRVALQTSLSSALRSVAVAHRVAPVSHRFQSTSTMHDNDPDTLEREKHKNLSGKQQSTHKDHAPGWNETLASASEAHVKADKDTSTTPESLTQRTIEHVHTRHHADDKTVGTEAVYEKDEIQGPLKSASGKQ